MTDNVKWPDRCSPIDELTLLLYSFLTFSNRFPECLIIIHQAEQKIVNMVSSVHFSISKSRINIMAPSKSMLNVAKSAKLFNNKITHLKVVEA
jgi:hypothetical protein